MSAVETDALEDVVSQCSLGSEHALANTDDADGRQDASDSGDDAHDIMVLALRSQIRETLQEQHQQEIAKVKQMYEVELGDLRADLITLQQFESKQLERQKRLDGQYMLECIDGEGSTHQCATLKARVIRLQDVIADMREGHAKELAAVNDQVEQERTKARQEWQDQVSSVRAWHAEAVAMLQGSHIEEVARLRDEHLAALHSARAAAETALSQCQQRHEHQVDQLTADAAAATANAAERQRCLEDQHKADMAAAKRRAATAVRNGCAAAAAEARETMQRRTAAAEVAAAAATDDATQARAELERERADNAQHQGLLRERLEAERGKLERERRLHEERMQELTAEAGKLRAGMRAVAADCRAVHAAVVPALRENSVLRAQLDAERLITSSLTHGSQTAGRGTQAFRPVSPASHARPTSRMSVAKGATKRPGNARM